MAFNLRLLLLLSSFAVLILLAYRQWLGGRHLVDSYHCSRYNTNTGRLTAEMFEAVFARAVELQAD